MIVFVGSDSQPGLLAYRADSGEIAWSAAAGKTSYSSPQPAQSPSGELLMIGDAGLLGVDPADGAVRWKYSSGAGGLALPIAQPQWVAGGDSLLIPNGTGIARVELLSKTAAPDPHQVWVSTDLKPSLNDFVVHENTVYGFDDGIFCARDLATGKRRWKKGRYGHGQVLLVVNPALLVVSGENGEVVLLAANPQRHEELGRFQAIEGKTWNHPAIVRGRLYVRNAEEMAGYDVASESLASRKTP